jgi:hypothetical protein
LLFLYGSINITSGAGAFNSNISEGMTAASDVQRLTLIQARVSVRKFESLKKMSTDNNRNLSVPDNAKPLLSLLTQRSGKPVLLAIIAVLLGVLVLQLFALRADKSQALEKEFLFFSQRGESGNRDRRLFSGKPDIKQKGRPRRTVHSVRLRGGYYHYRPACLADYLPVRARLLTQPFMRSLPLAIWSSLNQVLRSTLSTA